MKKAVVRSIMWTSAQGWELFLVVWELKWTGLGASPSFPSQPRLNIDWAELKAAYHLRAKGIINATARGVQNVLSTLQRCRASQASVLQSWYVSVNLREEKQIWTSSLSPLPSRTHFHGLHCPSGLLENQNTHPAPRAWGHYNSPQHLSCESTSPNTGSFAKGMGMGTLWGWSPLVSTKPLQPYQGPNTFLEPALSRSCNSLFR